MCDIFNRGNQHYQCLFGDPFFFLFFLLDRTTVKSTRQSFKIEKRSSFRRRWHTHSYRLAWFNATDRRPADRGDNGRRPGTYRMTDIRPLQTCMLIYTTPCNGRRSENGPLPLTRALGVHHWIVWRPSIRIVPRSFLNEGTTRFGDTDPWSNRGQPWIEPYSSRFFGKNMFIFARKISHVKNARLRYGRADVKRVKLDLPPRRCHRFTRDQRQYFATVRNAVFRICTPVVALIPPTGGPISRSPRSTPDQDRQ